MSESELKPEPLFFKKKLFGFALPITGVIVGEQSTINPNSSPEFVCAFASVKKIFLLNSVSDKSYSNNRDSNSFLEPNTVSSKN